MLAQVMLMMLAQAEVPSMLESWEVPSFEVVDETPQVFLISRAQKQDCPQLGSVCVSPGGSATIVGIEVSEDRPDVTVLARGTQVAAKGGLGTAGPDQPWQVEMVARFRARSEHGPIIVAVFDRDDPESIASKEAKVLWNVSMNPGRDLGMRFSAFTRRRIRALTHLSSARGPGRGRARSGSGRGDCSPGMTEHSVGGGGFGYSLLVAAVMANWFRFLSLLGTVTISLGCTLASGTGQPPICSDAGVLATAAYDPRRGSDSARVTMVEFGDFECPYCGADEPTVRKVLATYPDDVALIFVNFPISFHPYALPAAEAFLAAGRQAKAWEMHDLMYANQDALSDADLDSYAQSIGLDLVQFDADRSSPEIADEVAQDKNLGISSGVNATPTFYIDGCWMDGNQPFSAFQQVIDPATRSAVVLPARLMRRIRAGAHVETPGGEVGRQRYLRSVEDQWLEYIRGKELSEPAPLVAPQLSQ